MGVDPIKWGPGAWRFLHHASLAFPDQPSPTIKKAYRTFCSSLPSVLPCSKCRKHLRRTYKRLPPACATRASMLRWMHAVHAQTNVDLRKRVKKPPLESQLQGIRCGWRPGLRDFAFSIAFNCPRAGVPKPVRAFFRAARLVLGQRELPPLAAVKTKAQLLNTLLKHYRLSKAAVVKRYRPWLSKRSRTLAERVWKSHQR